MTYAIDLARIHLNRPYRSLCPRGWGYHDTTIQWCWACPPCEEHAFAAVTEHATAEEIAADARCWLCRQKEEKNEAL